MTSEQSQPESMQTETHERPSEESPSSRTNFLELSGSILAISYPILALSTGVRSLYQLLLKEGVTDYFPPAMSGVAALCYLLATVGFAVRKKWAWWLSVIVLGVETLLTLVIGSLSFVYPEQIGGTVWRAFGADYGYFPLIQPLIGLAWLLWSETRKAYGFTRRQEASHDEWTASSG